MNSKALFNCCLLIVGWSILLIEDSDREHPGLDIQDGDVEFKKPLIFKILYPHSGRHDNQPEWLTFILQGKPVSQNYQFRKQPNQNIRVNLSLMRLINYNNAVFVQVEIRTHLVQQYTVSHKFY